MAEKVKGLMVTLDKAKQGANKALFDFEAELKSLQCEVDALEETTTGLRTKLVLTQAQLSLTKEDVQRRQEREEKLQAELMTAKTEMAIMQKTQKDLEGQLAAASSSCKAMAAALKGEIYAVYDGCMVQLSSSEEVVRRLWEHRQNPLQYFLERKHRGVLASAFACLHEHVEEGRELRRKAVCTDVDLCLRQTLKDLAELSEDLMCNALAEKVLKALVKHGAAGEVVMRLMKGVMVTAIEGWRTQSMQGRIMKVKACKTVQSLINGAMNLESKIKRFLWCKLQEQKSFMKHTFSPV